MKIEIMLTLVLALAILTASARAVAQQSDRFVDLGVQITSSTMQGATFAKDPDGRDLLLTAMRGEPAKLLVFDVATGKLLHVFEMPGAAGAWCATTATDNTVYVGGQSNGHVYRYIPGEDHLVSLGQALPKQTFIWDLAPGPDGAVFGSTYPDCLVFRYHPDDGFTDLANGPVVPGENYGRGIAYDPQADRIYVGVGAHAHLIELDPHTGQRKNILPEKYADKKFIYAVAVTAGRVFGQVTDGSHLLVLNQQTGQEEALLPEVGSRLVSEKSPYDDVVYFTAGSTLYQYNLSTRHQSTVDAAPGANIQTFTWLPVEELGDGPALVGFVRSGRILKYHPMTGKSAFVELTPPGEPTPIQTIHLGPDGKIYSGGYLSGGLSAYDPSTGQSKQLGSITQPEGMTNLGDDLYLGLYPRARISVFDTTRPFDAKQKNPRQVGILNPHDQDRPFGMLGVESLGRVFIGTVSDYGRLGGALSIYDPKTEQFDVHRHIVPDQSVVSLAHHDGLIYAGTSIFGGLGIKPTATEAVLFIWDPAQRKKIFEMTPVPGALAITSLINGPDGNIWGMANDVLFALNPQSRELTFSKSLFNFDYSGLGHMWRGGAIVWHPDDGRLYGTLRGRLFRFDPQSHDLIVLRESNARLIALDRAGNIYFATGSHLWQYTPSKE